MEKELIWDIAEAIANQIRPNRKTMTMRNLITNIGGEILDTSNIFELSDGSIEKLPNNNFRILLYNGNATLERENFTIAHELGHLFLHMGFGTDRWENTQVGKSFNRNGNYDETEMEANQFAAAFLMPKEEYRNILYQNVNNNRIDIRIIAEYFGVSREAASNRGKWLGYLKW